MSKGAYECCAEQHYEHKWWNRELTLKGKLKCYVKPMKDPLSISPSKENQGTTRGKEKISQQSNGKSSPEVVGSIPNEVKRIFSLPRVVP